MAWFLPPAAAMRATWMPVRPLEVNIWGLSYHIDRTGGYNENNWGMGVRYSPRPDWRLLGHKPDNRLFVEADVLSNSYKGLAVPASIGLEYVVARMSHSCAVYFSAAFTAAYYHKPTD